VTDIRCEEAQRLIIGDDDMPPELVAHVGACANCRAAIAAILAERYAVPSPLTQPECAAMDDLPAYLDCELTEGEATAAVRFPDVWWHLWSCSDCAEEARLTRALLAAEATGELRPVPSLLLTSSTPVPWPALRLARDFLHQVFAPQLALGAAWGEDEPLLLAEEADGIYRVALYARNGAPGFWSLSVVVSPPVRAQAVLRFGKKAFRAPFDYSGTATIPAVPETLLIEGLGPPLEVRIEPDAA
jgi:hypothetical protein